MSSRSATTLLVCLAVAIGLALPTDRASAQAVWAGENGVVRLSFTEGDSLVSVFETGETEHGVTRIDLYGWLTDADAISLDKVAFTRIGGMEMTLQVEGAEAFITNVELFGKSLNIGRTREEIVAGLEPGYKIVDGRVQLVHWEIMFQGRPQNVRFSLVPVTSKTCTEVVGCAEAAPRMVYVGTPDSDINRYVLGAASEPAWLNPTGETDQTILGGACPWPDVGVAEAR